MKTQSHFALTLGKHEKSIPNGSEVKGAVSHGGKVYVSVAMTDEDEKETREFHVLNSGQGINFHDGHHIGTLELDGDIVDVWENR